MPMPGQSGWDRMTMHITMLLEALLWAMGGRSDVGGPTARPCRLSMALWPASCLLCSMIASTCPSCVAKQTAQLQPFGALSLAFCVPSAE